MGIPAVQRKAAERINRQVGLSPKPPAPPRPPRPFQFGPQPVHLSLPLAVQPVQSVSQILQLIEHRVGVLSFVTVMPVRAGSRINIG